MIGRKIALAAMICSGMQAPAFAQPRPAPAWQVDWGDYFCMLARLPSEDVPLLIAFRTVPGSFTASLRLIRMRRSELPRRISSIALAPSGQSFDVTTGTEVMPSGDSILVLGSLPEEFWEALSGATELQLMDGARVRLSIALSSSQAAVNSLRRCVSDAMQEWGVDEAALRALQRRPATTNAYGLSNSDYPMSALRAGRSGRVLVRITVSPEGRATDCAVVATSGDRTLDATTCNVIRQRARFAPALDANGQPTSARVANVVTWLTPR